MLLSLFLILIAYLLGSLNFAIIICKILGLPDPRHAGSHNPGATNVLRFAGKKIAILVMLCDVLKGTLAVVLGILLARTPFTLGIMALAVVLGHIFPVFFRFQGGKGVATMLGAVMALSPLLGGLFAITWLLVAFISKYSSLASILSTLLLPVYVIFFTAQEYFFPVAVLCVVVLVKHRGNISRLLNKTEPKIGKKHQP
jgi:glycerol-3-phosphate acyltransferase PlsY